MLSSSVDAESGVCPHNLFGKQKEQVIAKLNLASQPFRNRMLPWAVAVLVSVVSLIALVLIFAEHRRVRAESDAAERQVQALRAERSELERQAAEIRQTIPPEQRQILEAAHALVERKSFLWSQLFADLERSLPASVRVSRINVREVSQRGEQTTAELDLTVAGRAPNDVIDMMTEMNRGSLFRAVPVTENQRVGRGESGFEWTLRVSYVQRGRASSGAAGEGGEVSAAATAEHEKNSAVGGRE
jgi:Tfp pilus assembly protein PilN